MRTFLQTFSSFRTRYYKSSTGAESSAWLYDQVQGVIDVTGAGKRGGVTVERFEHSWGQSSVIARIPSASGGKGKKVKGKETPVVIVGAHQDSANMWPFLPAPGGMYNLTPGKPYAHLAHRYILSPSPLPLPMLQRTTTVPAPPRSSNPSPSSSNPNTSPKTPTSSSTGTAPRRAGCWVVRRLRRSMRVRGGW